MYIRSVKVRNFRLLKDFSIDLEEILSLVIGKNNCGKTSLLQILDKVLNKDKSKFQYHDFNIEYRKELFAMILGDKEITESNFKVNGIQLRLLVDYGDDDDLSCLGKILMDLDDQNHTAVLGYDFVLTYQKYLSLRVDLQKRIEARKEKKKSISDKDKENELTYLLSKKLNSYFTLIRKSIEFDYQQQVINEANYIDLANRKDFHEDELIAFGYIDARRKVDNKESDSTLSVHTSDLFEKLAQGENIQAINDFEESLQNADNSLTSNYDVMFKEVLSKIRELGGMSPNEMKLKIVSSLQQRELLKGNTTVLYNHNDIDLPESYNGLGYMNLISMIFQIEIIRQRFIKNKYNHLAGINLLIIEEPEAHTHPQMQYVFIKNIKKILKESLLYNGDSKSIQTIISTHSSHIVTESDFNDIKYLKRADTNSVCAKNMKDLEKEYEGEKEYYTFLKHYLTLSRSELFFAEKAVFIEGDTERILLPVMMKKLDQEVPLKKDEIALTKQNISIIEVGAYSHIFGKFINFIGLQKAVVFTDLDIGEKGSDNRISPKQYNSQKTQYSSNSSIKKYFGCREISQLIAKGQRDKRFSWDATNKCWVNNSTGNFLVCYQTKQGTYLARSFEDNFFAINKQFLKDNQEKIIGLQKKQLIALNSRWTNANVYDLAENGIKSKATFAVEIIYLSKKEDNKDFGGWNIPKYLMEGLLWLRK